MRIKNTKGQIAIFIAMIFPIIFLFFAMVINIGLLVHHKINLQNSVDIAAYYAAGKQAEMLGAIGHINYQIRQSYKLLSWRYRIMGTSGIDGGSTLNPVLKSGGPGQIMYSSADDENPAAAKYNDPFYRIPAFCVSFKPFGEAPTNENTCRTKLGLQISAISVPSVIAPWVPGLGGVIDAATKAQNTVYKTCIDNGSFNYVTLGNHYIGWSNDIADRKAMIITLAKSMSESVSNFKDISGDSVLQGVQNTIVNNVTDANKAGLKIEMMNSLAIGKCKDFDKDYGGNSPIPPNWLRDIVTVPLFAYMDSNCGTNGSVNNFVRQLTSALPTHASASQYYSDATQNSPYMNIRDDIHRASMGYEKNPWCMAYVGVKASAQPRIPFAPGPILLQAKSFAKPFGGRIGPWYGKTWAQGDLSSNDGGNLDARKIDSNLTFRGNLTALTADLSLATGLNYSRFPGDGLGLKSRTVQGEYGRAIHSGYTPWYAEWANVQKKSGDVTGDAIANLLAWGIGDGELSKTRKLEIAAIAPDLFDITYYTIDNNFYYHYYQGKLEKFFGSGIKHGSGELPGFPKTYLRFDLGSYGDGSHPSAITNKNSLSFSISDQLDYAKTMNGPGTSGYKLNFTSELKYALAGSVQLWKGLLTSWIPIGPKDYALDTTRFGNCLTDEVYNESGITPTDLVNRVPGRCLAGGRSGYSVKIVSKKYLETTDLKLGGDGTSGEILNKPGDF